MPVVKVDHFAMAEDLLAQTDVSGRAGAPAIAQAMATAAQAHATLALVQALATRPIVLDIATEDDPEGLIGEALGREVLEYRAAFGANELEVAGDDPPGGVD